MQPAAPSILLPQEPYDSVMEQYQTELAQWKQKMEEYNNLDEKKAYDQALYDAKNTIRFRTKKEKSLETALPEEESSFKGTVISSDYGANIIKDIDKVNADDKIHPIAKGHFGNIYNQFKGRVKEAFELITKAKEGDLLGVFHRDSYGDIDLVWGDEKGG